MEIPLTVVDFVVLGILLISGLFATYRGFLNETLSIVAYAVAAVGAVILSPVFKPFAISLVGANWLASALSLIAVFLILLIPLSFISFRFSEAVQGSPVGPLDRSLGFVFGVARGLLIVGAAYLVFAELAPPKDHPDWVKQARLLPVVKGTADVLRSIGGGKHKSDKDEATTQTAEDKPPKQTKPGTPSQGSSGSNSEQGSGEPGKTYGDGDRRALDQLVRTTNKP